MNRKFFQYGSFLVVLFFFAEHAIAQIPDSILNPPVPQNILKAHDEVMAYVDSVKPLKDLKPPPPPSTYYDYCYPCDKAKQKLYTDARNKFMKEYLGEEFSVMDKANSVLNYFHELRSKHRPFDSTAFLKLTPDMFHALLFLSKRIEAKVAAAWDKYNSEEDKLPFLVNLIVNQLHVNGMVEKEDSTLPSPNTLLQRLFDSEHNILVKAKEQHDYKILLNTAWINGLFHDATAAGFAQNWSDGHGEYLSINQFEFSIDAKCRVNGTQGGYYSAAFNSKFIMQANPDSLCHLKWTFPQKEAKYISVNRDEISFETGKGESPTFQGPENWYSDSPEVKLDFCDSTWDHIRFFAFIPGSPGHLTFMEDWNFRGHIMHPGVSMAAFTVGFPDKDRAERLVSGQSPERMASPYSFLIKQRLKNNDEVILEKELDGKQGPNARYVQYAKFKLRVVHVE